MARRLTVYTRRLRTNDEKEELRHLMYSAACLAGNHHLMVVFGQKSPLFRYLVLHFPAMLLKQLRKQIAKSSFLWPADCTLVIFVPAAGKGDK
jgi:hypothetical protein